MTGSPRSIFDVLAADVGRTFDATVLPGEATPMVNVRKVSHLMTISADLAMDAGLIPDTRPPVVFSRRQRFRFWRQAKLHGVRMRLASWLAGFDVEDRW